MSNTEDLMVLLDTGKQYLKVGVKDFSLTEKLTREVTMDFLALYRVDEITFEEKAPRKEALENVISSMHIPGIQFVYIIEGDSSGVRFYYGVAEDFSYKRDRKLSVAEIGEKILKPSLQGNFRGSVITEIDATHRKKIVSAINRFEETRILEGVPGINKDDEEFQSVDRVIDVMLGDKFAVLVIAKPLLGNEINNIQHGLYDLYDKIYPKVKESIQTSEGDSEGTSTTSTEGKSETKGTNRSTQHSNNEGTSESRTEGEEKGESTSVTTTRSKESEQGGENFSRSKSNTRGSSSGSSDSKTEGSSESETKSKSEGKTTQRGTNHGHANTVEHIYKKVQDWIKTMDDILFPRLDYGLGKGLFITSVVLLGENPASMIKMENTLKSVYGGESGNKMPLTAFSVEQEVANCLKNFQVPILQNTIKLSTNQMSINLAHSQFCLDAYKTYLGYWMSSKELSLLAGLPQKEVVGLVLREEVEFGLNVEKSEQDYSIPLGYLVQSGVVLNGEHGVPKIPINYDKSFFDKHIFVTGVTGGGKTTTCQKLLLASESNFLVIEPAKTEYRILSEEEFPDMLVFTLGKESGAPFRLNPFEFLEGENITSRVDMIKASMEAAFDMEAAIPQILETSIYECYEDMGWDVNTNKNYKFDNPFAEGVYSFPTLGDVEKKVEKVVKSQGFDERLKQDYIGSIKARLKGLTVGAKGQMLNTPRSIDFVELLDKKVVLELESIKNTSEKSLLMGFILANLSEAIRIKYLNMDKKPIHHLTLIEEAHRLLSKYMPGDSLNKKQGVEMFTDMLAEVRKYGESLIIADQIPDKLTPEVLKNTNTKIVHKIFAQDDKDAIGNTMALKKEQKEQLSYLSTGRAIMIMPGLSKAIQVQIDKTKENDTERLPPEDVVLRNKILSYYAQQYKRGVIPGAECFNEIPDVDLLEICLQNLQKESRLLKEYHYIIHNGKFLQDSNFINNLRECESKINLSILAKIIGLHCHKQELLQKYPETYKDIEYALQYLLHNRDALDMKKFQKEIGDKLDNSLQEEN